MRRAAFLILTLALISCGRKTLEAPDYVKWVTDPENGLVQVKELNPFKMELQYLPEGLIALRNKEQKNGIEREQKVVEFQLRLGSIGGTEFLKTDIQDMSEYHRRIEYYTSHAQSDLKLIAGLDTLDCVLSHFERTYGVSPYNTLMAVFEGDLGENDLTFIYNDRVLGIGRTKFTIKRKDLNRIPELRL